MAATKKQITRILISIIFIVYGAQALVPIIRELAHFDISGALMMIIGSAVAILMLLTGIFGLSGASIKVVRVLAVIVCVLCAAKFVLTLLSANILLALTGGSLPIELLVQALLAWIYFDC